MTIELPKISYTGRIKEIALGKNMAIGGESCYPFHDFEGRMPNPPRIAMEVWDSTPTDWAAGALAPFADVALSPSAWAQKCVDQYGAEMICLQLASTDPNGQNLSAEEAVTVVKSVAAVISVPLIVWGTASPEKDAEVLKLACEAIADKRLIVGPVETENYKRIAAAALGYGHIVAASSPIDVNLAKQLNILIGNLGLPNDCLIIDPTVSSLGYGLEYCYSVMERLRIAALSQNDERLQSPIICNIARETWKTKEAKLPNDPLMGDAEKRGIMMEALSAATLLLAGGDIVVMRHPEAIKLVQQWIAEMKG
ncbi:MAG: acetyl-CoA decarbonylase/synthase complex subunit delta [Dehalococcoidia bacterium]|nr:acetyl-CoA decarbonylase/synthase complex subunit delta [Dehalococcoidia bacterium]